MLDPERCKAFQDALKTLPMPCWNIHVNDHAKLFQDSVLNLAKQHFMTTSKTKTRPRLSELTLSLIQLKRSVLDFGRQCETMMDPEFKHQLKLIEKEVRNMVKADQQSFFEDLILSMKDSGDIKDLQMVY